MHILGDQAADQRVEHVLLKRTGDLLVRDDVGLCFGDVAGLRVQASQLFRGGRRRSQDPSERRRDNILTAFRVHVRSFPSCPIAPAWLSKALTIRMPRCEQDTHDQKDSYKSIDATVLWGRPRHHFDLAR
jgi:hypothetical protein